MYGLYKTGSCLFLRNNSDIDYAMFCWSEDEFSTTPSKPSEIIDGVRHQYHKSQADYYFSNLHLWDYLFGNMQYISGDDHLDEYKDRINMFNLKTEQEYKAYLKLKAGELIKESKHWYHILTAIYLYQNKSPYLKSLTEEQLENIQKIHDEKCISDDMYNYIIAEISKW